MIAATMESKNPNPILPSKELAHSAAFRMDDIVIGPGVRTAGKFQTTGSIFADGTLENAEVECQSISIGRGAELHGSVRAGRVEISGLVHVRGHS